MTNVEIFYVKYIHSIQKIYEIKTKYVFYKNIYGLKKKKKINKKKIYGPSKLPVLLVYLS